MSAKSGLFWQDLDRERGDREFDREFVLHSITIATSDRVINELDDARMAQGLTKAELARAIGADPAVVRRLFASRGNPTMATVSQLASALGLQVTLARIPANAGDAVVRVVSATAVKTPAKSAKVKAGKAKASTSA